MASAVAAGLLGRDVGAVGVPTYRAPLVPISFAQVAGRDRGPILADPIRTTAMQAWHVARGAVFEDVGQGKRPRYFPLDPDDRSLSFLPWAHAYGQTGEVHAMLSMGCSVALNDTIGNLASSVHVMSDHDAGHSRSLLRAQDQFVDHILRRT